MGRVVVMDLDESDHDDQISRIDSLLKKEKSNKKRRALQNLMDKQISLNLSDGKEKEIL